MRAVDEGDVVRDDDNFDNDDDDNKVDERSSNDVTMRDSLALGPTLPAQLGFDFFLKKKLFKIITLYCFNVL